MLESRIPSTKTLFSKPKKILVSRWVVDIDGQDLILVEEWGPWDPLLEKIGDCRGC